MAVELPKAAKMKNNGEIVLKLDTTPTSEAQNLVDIRDCFENIGFAMNEVVQKIQFLSDNGYSTSWVSGADITVTLTGRYIDGHPLCEYLRSIEHEILEKRCTNYTLEKFGIALSGSCTITALTIGGGTATEGAPINMTVNFNGKPTVSGAA
ncbi:MAG: hypothetical protein NC084_09670 [Bacteroides sp.]|nr:hypothetical protein [Eubacterium sp.]MCM1419627.1 hypothetical protein [Roseburia sp.]MCM1462965.1 hypothetical protein [Bacteroides sp.]